MLKKAVIKYLSLPVQVRAAFWFLFCSFMQKGITSITTPIFTRLLSPAEYGQFSVFNSWMSIVTVFVSLSLYNGVYMQELVKYEEKRNEYSSSMQGLTLTLVVIWTGIYLLFREFWNTLLSVNTVQMLAMLLMIWSTAVFNFWASYQRVYFQYRKLVAVTILVSFCKPLIGIIFVMNTDDKVTARILGLTLVELVAYTGLFVSQMHKGKIFYSKEYWKHALLFSLPLIPHYLSNMILNSADRIMISRMVNDSKSGIYSLAYSLSLIMTMFNTALQQTLEPWRYKKLKEGHEEALADIAYPTLLMIALLNLLLIAFAPEIVALFAPAEYYDAIWVIPPISMSTYFMFIFGYFAVFEFFYEKTKYTMLATSSGAILNIILNYIFIRLYGYYAAGYTTLVCYIVYAVMHYYFMRKICIQYLKGKRIYSLKILTVISIGFMIAGFFLLMTYNNQALRYGCIVLFLALMVIKRNAIVLYIRKLIAIRMDGKK